MKKIYEHILIVCLSAGWQFNWAPFWVWYPNW